jgi:hypothetical protein
MNPTQIINKLATIEAAALMLAHEAAKAKKDLESFHSSAPHRGKKKPALSMKELASLKTGFAKTALRK